MALKSVIDIAVNDGEFQKFASLFQKYQQQVKTMPNDWKKVGDEVDGVLDKTAEGVENVGDATQGVAKSSGQMAVNFRQTFVHVAGQAAGLQKVAANSNVASRHASQQAASWKAMEKSSKGFASHIGDATRSLLRWASLTGLVSGLLGAGGLFGIERLANSAAGSRRSSMGLGMSVGQEKAFGLNYGRVFENPDSFLSGVNDARMDQTKWSGFVMNGVNNPEGKSTAELSEELLPALKRLADNTDEKNMGSTFKNHGIDQFMTLQDFERLKHTSQSELNQYGQNYKRDAADLNLPPAVLTAWTDLQVQLRRAGESIEKTFINGLANLADPIDHLSGAFTTLVEDIMKNKTLGEWIDKLAKGMESLSAKINDPEFSKHVDDFMDGVGKLADAIGAALKKIYGFAFGETKPDGTKIPPLISFGSNGDITDDNARMPGSPAWRAARDAAKAGSAPLPNSPAKPPEGVTDGATGQPEDTLADKAKRAWDRMRGNDPWTDPEDKFGIPHGGLSALERQESGGRDVEGPMTPWGTAKGYAQFMDATAKTYGVNVHDEKSSMYGSGNYLSDLHKQWGSWDKTLAAYNGAGRLKEIIDKWGDNWREHTKPETQKYLNSVGPAFGVAQQRIKVDVSINGATPGTNPTASAAVVAH